MDKSTVHSPQPTILKIFIATLSLCFLFSLSCLARDIKFEVTVDKNIVSLGDTAELDLKFYGAQDISAPDLPDIHGFDWHYLGPATQMSILNGKVSSSITHMYVLMPLEKGEFIIPPLSVYYRGKTYNSEPIPIEVVKGPVPSALRAITPPSGPSGEPQEEARGADIAGLQDRIFLRMETERQTAYENEIIPMTIKLYIDRLSIRDIQYPSFAHKGFLADEFEEPRQYQEVLRGERYHVIEFNTNLSGLRPGEHRLGPAELTCNLLVKKKNRFGTSWPFDDDDFFGRNPFGGFFRNYEKQPLRLESFTKTITVLALPQEGVPAAFNGAVGNFQFSTEATPRDVKAGDPITLKMEITGRGNFNTVRTPKFKTNDDFKVYDPQIKQDKTGKTFEQIVIPKNDRIKEIPAITFSFFDTREEKYKTIERGPIPITVNPLPRGEELKIFDTAEGVARALQKQEILGRDIIYIKDKPGELQRKGRFLCENKLFIAAGFIPLIAIIVFLIFYRRKERLRRDISYARRLRAPRKARRNLLELRRLLRSGKADKFFDAGFKALQEYLGDKFHLPSASITQSVIDTLRSRGVNEDALAKIKEFLETCDSTRYAPSDASRQNMNGILKLLEEIIRNLER